jgi:GntR family transcriptional repressor for pyruvate dehydrogenase complex
MQEMERILDEQGAEITNGGTGIQQDAQFHAAIGAAAHNRAITRIVNAIVDLLAQSREEALSTPGRPERSHEAHRRILLAITKHDTEGAREAMLDHLVTVEGLVLRPSNRPSS